MTSTSDTLVVGGYRVPMATAAAWVADYTDAQANARSVKPFAYPAYDRYRADDNQPAVLDDADFLAPTLLNVSISIRSFSALQRNRGHLENALAHDDLARPLADLSDTQISHLIGDLFAILDSGDDAGTDEGGEATSSTLPGIGGTKLSKVLHRKRPTSIPLHDRWVWACYVGEEGSPVPRERHRTWRGYMTLIAQAMARDLRDQQDQFAELQAASKASPPLTDLRLLDIVAWNAGQRPRAALQG